MRIPPAAPGVVGLAVGAVALVLVLARPSTAPAPGGPAGIAGPVVTVTAFATVTVPAAPSRSAPAASVAPVAASPAPTLPYGAEPGPRPGTFYVDCFKVQCTTAPGAGPDGTTCGAPHTGMQLCQ